MKTITQNLQTLKSSLEDKPQINIVVVTKTRSPEEIQEAIRRGNINRRKQGSRSRTKVSQNTKHRKNRKKTNWKTTVKQGKKSCQNF